MPSLHVLGHPSDRPIVWLVCLCALWKAFVLVVACLSPGSGYDSSSSLLLHPRLQHAITDGAVSPSSHGSSAIIEKLARWDAIYFGAISKRGYLFEQEWAFGWGFTSLVARLCRSLDLTGSADAPPTAEITVAVVLAHIAHLFSIIVLYYLTKAAFPSSSNKTFPFISAALHIISPAGLFLSAPYGEPLFSCLNFLGYLLYLWSVGAGRDQKPFQRDLNVVLAGFTLGLAATVRSNGLLSGIPFLYDSLLTVHTLSRGIEILHATRKLIVLGVGGSLVGLGFAVPQWLAHVQYCQGRPVSGEGGLRPWCTRTVPSIYAWVQDQYWNVGFLRYWTLSNLPLFLLAAPMLAIMSASAAWALRGGHAPDLLPDQTSQPIDPKSSRAREQQLAPPLANDGSLIPRLAAPQLLLTILAFTSYHVQIITRLSSGYPVWYWWLASMMSISPSRAEGRRDRNLSKLVVRWMVIYAVVQGGLFASFLPPA